VSSPEQVHDELIRLYAKSDDPWAFRSSWYERRKYALTLASLPRERYVSGYEPGCSIGVLTRLLAERCDALVGSDLIPHAVDAARALTADTPHVRIVQLDTPREWPAGAFDLIVLSELAYFLKPANVAELGRRTGASARPGAHIVAVHWRGTIDEWALPANEAHDLICETGGLRRISRYEEERFLLEVFER
jgi:SAM-dependent methyltransferase